VVRSDHDSAPAWLALLRHEEGVRSGGVGAAAQLPLARLYEHATRLLPRAGRSRDEAFLRIWLGHARQQAAVRGDDARDTFKFLRSQRLGDSLALMWLSWAAFEASLGRKDKASAVLAKGLEHGAQPTEALIQAQADLATGRPLMAPALATPQVAQSHGGGATMTSGTPHTWLPRGGEVHTATMTAPPSHAAGHGGVTLSGSTASLTSSTSTTSSSATGGNLGGGGQAPVTGDVPSTATLAGLVAGSASAAPTYSAGAMATPGSAVGGGAMQRGSSSGAPTTHGRTVVGSALKGSSAPLAPAPEDREAEYDTDGHLVAQEGGRSAEPAAAPVSVPPLSAPQAAMPPLAAGAAAPRRALGMPRADAPAPVVDPDATVPVPKRRPAAAAPPPAAPADEDATIPVTRPRAHPVASAAAPVAAQPRPMAPPPSMAPPPAPSIEELAARQRARAVQAAPPAPAAAPAAPAGMPTRGAPVAAAAPAGPSVVPGGRSREDDTFVHVRGVRYTKLECVGQGGTCKVFKVITQQRKVLAVKRIRLTGGHAKEDAIANFLSEIALLERLRGRANIIQLIDSEVIRQEGLIYLVLEFGETDLAQLLARRAASRAATSAQPQASLDDDVIARVADNQNFLRLYFQQMCEAVATIHAERIIHSDLKPANFLIVEGSLKLIDFGIAKAVAPSLGAHDTTHIVREHQVGTINYMSPEAVLNGQCNAHGAVLKVGRASDVWSLGCILYQMVYGRTPFSYIANMVHKLAAITNPGAASHLAFPPTGNPALEDLMRSALAHDPAQRITLPSILMHPFIRPQQQQPPSREPSGAVVPPSLLASVLLGAAKAGARLTPAAAATLAQELTLALHSGLPVPDVAAWLAAHTVEAAPPPPRVQPPPPPPTLPPPASAAPLPPPATHAPMAPPPPVSLDDLMRQRKALKAVPLVEPPAPAVPAGAGGLHASADELARQKQLLRPAPAAAPGPPPSLFDASSNPAMAALHAAVLQRHVAEEAGTQTLAWGAPT
jgi:serine/threonine-protein kinase TTK/MPS1